VAVLIKMAERMITYKFSVQYGIAMSIRPEQVAIRELIAIVPADVQMDDRRLELVPLELGLMQLHSRRVMGELRERLWPEKQFLQR
jgi:hypothetical protein